MRSEFTPGISLKIRFRLQPRSQGLSSSLPLKRKRRGKTLGTGGGLHYSRAYRAVVLITWLWELE